MSLPLRDRVTQDNPYFAATAGALQPDREQYRFHFDMTKCIGCHCCEVACNEQNNNPAGIHWRRVGEIEGGSYPYTQRFYLSMGCNHCLEPACLTGCPVDAYTKHPANGLVLHSALTCIGCQYCIWNCPYGVPQYNPERGVVGKCDMCYGRLAEGRDPACVSACPEEAIAIETVDIAEWQMNYASSADSPGLPAAAQTISTTRVTLPASMPADVRKADYHRVRPEQPHLPLVAMTVLTQMAVGAFCCVWLLGASWTLAALAIAFLALASSTLHLGRPVHAYRALKMWRRSWLSREVLLFTLFAGCATAYSAALRFGSPLTGGLGAATALFGLGGVAASACIYLVPARPAWNSRYTVAEFFLTAAILGPLLCGAGRWPALFGQAIGLPQLTAAAAMAQLLNQGLKFLWLIRSDEFELKGSARLLSADLKHLFLARLGLLVAGGVMLPLAGFPVLALLVALAGELLGRYLFFVSVVPRNMAAGFFENVEVAA